MGLQPTVSRTERWGEISEYTHSNLRELLAVGFDPERTRIVVDTADADVVYPLATTFATGVTQATHLLFPQLVDGRHPTLIPIAVDQDPHVRICRDIAAKRRYDVDKPGALLSKFLPSLEGPGKMSASDDAPGILLSDDRETVFEEIAAEQIASFLERHRSRKAQLGPLESELAEYRLREDERTSALRRAQQNWTFVVFCL